MRGAQWRGTPFPTSYGPMYERQVMSRAGIGQTGGYTIGGLPAGDFIVSGICYNTPDGEAAHMADVLESSYEAHLEPGESVTLDFE